MWSGVGQFHSLCVVTQLPGPQKFHAPSAAQADGEKLNRAMNVRRVTARIFAEVFERAKTPNSRTRRQRFRLMQKLLITNIGKSRANGCCAGSPSFTATQGPEGWGTKRK